MSQSRPTDAEATTYAESYVLYGNQSRAFRAAFPDSKASDKAINERASVFHRIQKVCERIEELRELGKKVAEEQFQLTTADVVRGLHKEATLEGDGSIHSARVSAWKALGDHTGGFDANKQKHEHSGEIAMVIASDENDL